MTSKEHELELQADPLPVNTDQINDNAIVSSRINDSTSKRNNRRQYNCIKYIKTMLNCLKEVTLMLLVIFTYAALTNKKITKSPSAYPFFHEGSYVTDWYRGEVTKAIEQARASDVCFVMFYAPWDATSQAVRKEFSLTAEYMHKEVTFTAINCWQPGSECKKQYTKVYRWPVLIAYPTHGRGIQYNGPLDAAHMIRFLQNFCKPIKVVQNLNKLISLHDAVIVANLSPYPGNSQYAAYYLAALRYLEKDPFNDIIFGVINQSPKLTPKLSLHLWNETISFHKKWTPESILTWISKHSYQVTGWINPSGSKSLSLSNYLQPGPALILFTPKNPFFQHSTYYSVLKQLAFEYFNCANNNTIVFKQKLIQLNRLTNYLNYQQLRLDCHEKTFSTNKLKNGFTLVPKLHVNTTIEKCVYGSFCDDYFNMKQICERITSTDIDYSHFIKDLRTTEYLKKYHISEKCVNINLSKKFNLPIYYFNTVNNSSNLSNYNISGMACTGNRSLTFVAMDSLRFYHFAEKLGIDLFESKDKTAVAIVDEKMETHYVMNSEFSVDNLRKFITEYSNSSLRRALRSNSHVKSRNTHYYRNQKCLKSDANSICITDLETQNFLDTILEENRTVLVFYYSKQCAFCSGIAHIFLLVAKLLSPIENIHFTRIDGDLNLLPWEYTMESYPTILFFPPKRKSESRVYPKDSAITVPNLLNFILINLSPELRLESMWIVCNQSKYKDINSNCMISLRMETLVVIDNMLKKWRNADSRARSKIFHTLQLLRHLHLSFAHLPKKKLIQNYFKKLNQLMNNFV